MKTYYIGLLKRGDTVVLEMADTVDQISCECWKYYGERERSIAHLKRESAQVLRAINEEHGTQFSKLVICRVASMDYTAGHKDVTA